MRCPMTRWRSCAPIWSRNIPLSRAIGEVRRLAGTDLAAPAGDAAALGRDRFVPVLANYYQTDPISRASPTMAACVATHYPALAEAAE